MKLTDILIEVVAQAFFDKVKNPEEARALYRELAKKYHPDKGGSTEIMQAINSQYQDYLKKGNKKPTSTPTSSPHTGAADYAKRNSDRDRDYQARKDADEKRYRDANAAAEKRYRDAKAKYEKDWNDRQTYSR